MNIHFGKHSNLIFLIIVVALALLYSSYLNHQTDERYQQLEQSGSFTLGSVLEYSPSHINGNITQAAFLKISFNVNGKNHVEASDYNVPAEDGPLEGAMFMVIYLPQNPAVCAMLLDCPVKNAADYTGYIKEFKMNRPRLNR